jgi:hypothetical protein
MTMLPIHASARLVFPLAVAAFAALMGCTSVAPQRPAADNQTPERRTAAAPAPVQPIANFSPALRCMDTLLLDYGARDLTVIVEDLADQTKGTGGGAKDTLNAVVADMTQRSRAIRLVASGKDWGNTVNAMLALKQEQFAVTPQYALRGSINLLDNQTVQRNGENVAASVLGIDLTMLTTQDLSVVPGIATRNSVVLFRQGKAYDGKAEIRKFGVNFGLSASGGDVVGHASRALVELASIELFGRLARVPYWTCLGMTEAHEGVAAEIQGWYDTMASQPSEIIRYFQTQLRARRIYEGPIDGAINAQLKEAVARYREALGLTRENKISLDFFKAYLAADHREIEGKLAPTAPAPTQVAAAPAPAPAVTAPIAPRADTVMVVTGQAPKNQLALRVGTVNDVRRFGRGEPVQLTIRPSRDAHVYCFLQDETKKIIRFFPNRFQRDSRVQTAEGLTLPGSMRFEIVMNPRGLQETISCFATERDVLAQLPAGVNVGDFDPLPVASLDQVKSAFVKAANGALAQETFQLQPK